MSTFLENAMTETNLPSSNFLPIDLNFINNPIYAELSVEAMMLHALYTMRMTCSIYNSKKDGTWLDDQQQPYIFFSNEEAAALLRVSERKVTDLRNKLANCGLIAVRRHGLKNYRIYVANPLKPAKDVAVTLAFKNYAGTKQIKDEQVVQKEKQARVPDAKSARTQTQNLLTSTEKQLDKNKTNATNVTREVPEPAPRLAADTVLITGLQARYQHLLPRNAFQRFLAFCDNDYEKAKWYVDTIFKAKYVSNRQFIQAGLPAESEVLTFETNRYYTQDIANAIARAIEQMYRYKTVENPEAFFFAFMKGFFTEKTRQYLVDHYELTPALAKTLEQVQWTSQTRKTRASRALAS